MSITSLLFSVTLHRSFCRFTVVVVFFQNGDNSPLLSLRVSPFSFFIILRRVMRSSVISITLERPIGPISVDCSFLLFPSFLSPSPHLFSFPRTLDYYLSFRAYSIVFQFQSFPMIIPSLTSSPDSFRVAHNKKDLAIFFIYRSRYGGHILIIREGLEMERSRTLLPPPLLPYSSSSLPPVSDLSFFH